MSNQKSDYELAYGELQHALKEHGEAREFWNVCDSVEDRLIDAYPEDEVAVIEMIAAWLVHLGVHPEGELQGKV
ncbi:hypothetical protein D3C81_949820 [compost metagenome]